MTDEVIQIGNGWITHLETFDKTVFVRLLDEGTPAARRTTARHLGGDLYELNATPDYDPDDEHWEVLPGTKVRIIRTVSGGQILSLAVEAQTITNRE